MAIGARSVEDQPGQPRAEFAAAGARLHRHDLQAFAVEPLTAPVDDPALVRVLRRFGDIARDRQRLPERGRTPRNPLGRSGPSISSITVSRPVVLYEV